VVAALSVKDPQLVVNESTWEQLENNEDSNEQQQTSTKSIYFTLKDNS
jgi:hypothetical protein